MRYATAISKIRCKSSLFTFAFLTAGGLFAGRFFSGFGGFLERLLRALFAGLLARRRTFAAGEDVVPVVRILFRGSDANDAHDGIVLLKNMRLNCMTR